MGFWDTLTNVFTGEPAKKAADQNRQLYDQNYQRGIGQLNEGFAGAKDAYGNAVGAYSPLSALAGQFGQGTNMYMNALGLNGPGGNAAATAAFQAGPSYEWQRNQALEAATRGAAARSMGSIGGNQLTALAGLGSNLANQEYGNWLGRLQGFGNQQLAAQNAASGGIAGQYGALAGANMTNAQNLANLGTTTTSGLANANQQEAQAQMDGSKNLWGVGLGLANLAFGSPGFTNGLKTAGNWLGDKAYGAYGATITPPPGRRVGPFPY